MVLLLFLICTKLNRMIRFKYLYFISLVVGFWSCGKKQEGFRPEVGSITDAVYASGKVKARDQYTVFPLVSGRLQKIFVQSGDTVALGQVLFQLDNTQSKLNSENSRLALDLVRENAQKQSDRIQELEQNIRLARDKFRLDSSLFERQKTLWNQNIGTRNDFEQRKLAFESSRSGLANAISRLNQLKTQLQNELSRAEINYRITNNSANDFLVRSEFKGRVFDVLKKKGELVSPQTPLAVIGRADAYLVELQVNENDIARIQVGQLAELTFEAFPGKVYSGRIERIVPIMNDRTRNFQVDAAFEQLPEKLFPNMNTEANIVILKKENALTIPRRLLQEGQYVWVSDKEKREVKVGLKDFQKVEILSGIDSSTLIYLPPK